MGGDHGNISTTNAVDLAIFPNRYGAFGLEDNQSQPIPIMLRETLHLLEKNNFCLSREK